MSNTRNKKRDLFSLGLAIAFLLMLNYVGSFVFHRFDLTSEKRYTLSDATKELLKNLDDVVFVKVYLEGDFPAGFKRLRNETKEMLDEFRAYSDNNIEYEFINPSDNPDKKQQNEFDHRRGPKRHSMSQFVGYFVNVVESKRKQDENQLNSFVF